MIVYEVIISKHLIDSDSLGIFSDLKWARILVRDVGKKEGWPRINASRYGIEDDYGLIQGVFILKRKIHSPKSLKQLKEIEQLGVYRVFAT